MCLQQRTRPLDLLLAGEEDQDVSVFVLGVDLQHHIHCRLQTRRGCNSGRGHREAYSILAPYLHIEVVRRAVDGHDLARLAVVDVHGEDAAGDVDQRALPEEALQLAGLQRC